MQEGLVAIFDAEVLPLLDATTHALFRRVGQACRDAVLRAPKLPCAGRKLGVNFDVDCFVGSVELLAWAKENGCPWDASVCTPTAKYGPLHTTTSRGRR